MTRFALPLLVLALLGTLLWARPVASDGWRRTEPPLDLAWPRDHGAHFDARTEWWYATGELVDDSGREYGFQFTLFRQGLDARPPQLGDAPSRARHALAAHSAVVDVAAGRLRHVERVRRLGAGLAGASATDLDAWLEDHAIRRDADGSLRVRAAGREAGYELDLVLTPSKPVVLHGEGGVSRKGPEPGNASAYASLTRLAVSGRLVLDGRTISVRGAAWFDHEWGTSQLGAGVVGWDWSGLRLDDGRELMLYRLRRADGSPAPESAGTLVERDGRVRPLARTDFEMTPMEHWESPTSGARYPVRWRVRVPSAGVEGELAARVEACEVDGRLSTGTIYWEGPARLAGSASGSGYLELAGYADSLSARF